MSAIKRFFEKKKLDVKFKQAGQGHSLNESHASNSASSSSKHPSSTTSSQRRQPTQATSQAAEAAMARLGSATKQKKKPTVGATTTWKNPDSISQDHNAIDNKKLKNEVLHEIKQDNTQARPRLPSNKGMLKEEQHFESSPKLTCVSFCCPVCPVCLPESDINEHIEECLTREIDTEPGMIAASMIHTLNSKGKVQLCVATLNKYLDNLIDNPNEEKYRQIKQSNKIFRERVFNVKGVKELLTLAIGFVDVKLPIPGNEEAEESFFILSEGLAMDSDRLMVIKEYINEAEPLKASLDRNVKVLEPAPGASNVYMPDEFYDISNIELKQEKLNKQESVEQSKKLMTKSMRDAAQQSAKRSYRFTLIRIRFPDGNMLEGTFYSKDKLSEVESFVKESIELDWLPFEMLDASGRKLKQLNETLESLNLSPAAILNFQWDSSLAADIRLSNKEATQKYLTDELLARKISL